MHCISYLIVVRRVWFPRLPPHDPPSCSPSHNTIVAHYARTLTSCALCPYHAILILLLGPWCAKPSPGHQSSPFHYNHAHSHHIVPGPGVPTQGCASSLCHTQAHVSWLSCILCKSIFEWRNAQYNVSITITNQLPVCFLILSYHYTVSQHSLNLVIRAKPRCNWTQLRM